MDTTIHPFLSNKINMPQRKTRSRATFLQARGFTDCEFVADSIIGVQQARKEEANAYYSLELDSWTLTIMYFYEILQKGS